MGVVRTLLAAAVVLGHAGSFFLYNITGSGQLAVQMFYIISGFYMTLVLTEKYATAPVDFYLNRALRLLPTYWIICAGALIAYGVLYEATGGGFFAEFSKSLRGASPAMISWAVLSNTSLVGLDWLTGKMPLLIAPAWTLGLEVTFYALAPMIVRRNIGVLVALLGLSVLLRLSAYLVYGVGAPYTRGAYQFFPFELALFLAGALSYRLYARIRDTDVGRWCGLSLIPAVLLLQVLQKGVTLSLPGNSAALVTCWVVFFSYFALAVPFLFRDTRASALDARIGALSYPLYLIHYPLLELYKGVIDGGDSISSRATRSAVLLLASLALAYVIARYVDARIDRIRRPAQLRPPPER